MDEIAKEELPLLQEAWQANCPDWWLPPHTSQSHTHTLYTHTLAYTLRSIQKHQILGETRTGTVVIPNKLHNKYIYICIPANYNYYILPFPAELFVQSSRFYSSIKSKASSPHPLSLSVWVLLVCPPTVDLVNTLKTKINFYHLSKQNMPPNYKKGVR